jgi:hypothetical protein
MLAALLLLPGLALPLPASGPAIRWTGPASLELALPGGPLAIHLSPASALPSLVTPCLWSGRLEGDPGSLVAVRGCWDTETTVTIGSTSLPGGVIELIVTNGTSQIVGHDEDMGEEAGTDERFRRQVDDDDDYDYYDYDYDESSEPLIPDEDPYAISALYEGPWPTELVMQIYVKYDNSLLKHFRGSHAQSKDWLNQVIMKAKPRLLYKSLNMAIHLTVKGEFEHIDESIRAGAPAVRLLAKKYESANLDHVIAFFGAEIGGDKTHGIAFLGAACNTNGQALAITELYYRKKSIVASARTLAHELGHTMGIRHDHDPVHGGRRGPCNHKGIMSYGRRPDQWSECSKKDFAEWWREKGYVCILEPEGSTATTPSPQITGRLRIFAKIAL